MPLGDPQEPVARACASGVAAVLATVLLAWLANPAVSSAKPAVLSPVREAARTLALEVRLDRLPATLSLATTIEGKLDPGPLVGSDRANVVADALAALPVSQGMATATRRRRRDHGQSSRPTGSSRWRSHGRAGARSNRCWCRNSWEGNVHGRRGHRQAVHDHRRSFR